MGIVNFSPHTALHAYGSGLLHIMLKQVQTLLRRPVPTRAGDARQALSLHCIGRRVVHVRLPLFDQLDRKVVLSKDKKHS